MSTGTTRRRSYTHFWGTPKVTRQDSSIDFGWGNGAPDYQIAVDHFSARWTRKLALIPAGNSKFTSPATMASGCTSTGPGAP